MSTRKSKSNRVKVGVIGCGSISGAYFKNMPPYGILEVAACADLDVSRAEAKAREFNIPRACAVDELLNDRSIRIVLNLTVPKAHATVNLAAIRRGKSVYCEKPLAVSREEGSRTLAAARKNRVLLGCAPDTFLGGGIQTCRKLIDDGWIGRPVAAMAFMTCHGHESWHPSPAFYYEKGGGPMFDMGPYYLTALVNLLGPVKRVTGSAQIAFPERLITSQPLCGTRVRVETPTHIAGVMDFANGAVGTIVTSFDVWSANLPRIEVHGTQGSLSVPDPNGFGGPVRIWLAGASEWSPVPLTHSDKVGRGIGVADMACALVHRRQHRASGELAFHVLDVMQAFEEASKIGRHIEIRSPCRRPAALPMNLRVGELD